MRRRSTKRPENIPSSHRSRDCSPAEPGCDSWHAPCLHTATENFTESAVEGSNLEMRKVGVYLREEEELVGPFYSRQDAEYFLFLMELLGTSSEGIEIVEIDIATRPGGADDVYLDHDTTFSSRVPRGRH